MKEYNVAVVGATGAVGQKMVQLLGESELPIRALKLLASSRSAGRTVPFRGQEITIEETTDSSFEGIDIALFSAGGSISKRFAPAAVASGAVVVDNTSAFRMEKDVPLVVPEVNAEELQNHSGIIANPNCSTIQMVVALEPIRQAYGLQRVIVSTYQAVSGAGLHALEELDTQTQAIQSGEEPVAAILPSGSDKKHFPIAFNVLPQIDVFGEEGYTLEEWKMINETRKIMGIADLLVSATCVRVPVKYGHSESVYLEVASDDVTVEDIRNLLKDAPGIQLQDDPNQQLYPTALATEGKKDTFVGRIRKDIGHPRGFHLWIVSDNLVKGAAWNSVQIAEQLAARGLLDAK